MSYRRQNILCVIISCIIMITTFMALGYCLGDSKERIDFPYGMSSEYKKFTRTEETKTALEDIVDLEKDNQITILSEDAQKEYLGLYDPRYYYYNENRVEAIGETRYFSKEDYLKRTKAGIGIVGAERELLYKSPEKEAEKSDYMEECIFLITRESVLYREGIQCILNLAAVEELGSSLYIDSEDKEQLEEIGDRLEAAGYREEITEKRHIAKFKDFLPVRLYGMVIFVAALSLYPIFGAVCFMVFYNNRRTLKIHILYGGSRFQIFWQNCSSYLITGLLLSFVTGLSCFIFLRDNLLSNINGYEAVEIYLFHTVAILFFYSMGYLANIRKLTVRGCKYYVK